MYIAEYLIPSGWKVLPVFTAAHFDLNLHENPSEFNPSRWTVCNQFNLHLIY